MNEQNGTEFAWDDHRNRAALELAQGWIPDQLIAKHAHAGRTTLSVWKQHPAFQARIEEHRQRFEAEAIAKGLAARDNRVAAKNDRWARLQRVIEERAVDPQMQTVPGGRTGLLVHQRKMIGNGPKAILIDEYAVDTGTLKEMRELEESAAKDLGQWVERRSVNEDELAFARRYAKEERGLNDEEADRLARVIVGARR